MKLVIKKKQEKISFDEHGLMLFVKKLKHDCESNAETKSYTHRNIYILLTLAFLSRLAVIANVITQNCRNNFVHEIFASL